MATPAAGDIGYSNAKFGFGPLSNPAFVALPAGAGPAHLLPESIVAGGQPGATPRTKDSPLHVMVNDEHWVAGIEPHRLQGWTRDIHEDYPSSDTYKALFHAILLAIGHDQISHFVTGLPVEQWKDRQRRARLSTALTGMHHITPGRSVTIERVTVLPQPGGGYMDLTTQTDDLTLLEQGRILVVDPGFYSVDWVILEGGEIHSASSGTSTRAMSTLLEYVNDLIAREAGIAPGPTRVERAVRQGEAEVLAAGKPFPLATYLEHARAKVPARAIAELRRAVRSDEAPVDAVLVVGGGTPYYVDAIQEAFPSARVLTPDQPVLANVRGFWRYAAMQEAAADAG